MFFHTSSLDAPLTQADGLAKLADLIGADDPELERAVDMDAVGAHWNELPSRERHILLMRFYGNLTQAEIGERLGISQMHVSRLQATALRYLRECLLGQDPDDDRRARSLQRRIVNRRKETGMKTATGLAIVAVGAILAFAVTGHPGWLNVQAAGWVLILVGLAGMFVPRRGYGWLRRRVVRRPHDGPDRGPRRRGDAAAAPPCRLARSCSRRSRRRRWRPARWRKILRSSPAGS